VERSDITVTESIDQKRYTLTFKSGSFVPRDHFHFGTSVFHPLQGSTGEDADRMAGMTITVRMEDGTTHTGTVTAQEEDGINRFTAPAWSTRRRRSAPS
jgi:hypothetical protein